MKAILISCLAASVLAFYGCGDSVVTPNKTRQEERPYADAQSLDRYKAEPKINKIKPETIITFPGSSLACIEREDLLEAINHGARGELTKMKAMMIDPDTGEGQCLMLSKTLRYKVIYSEYNDEKLDVGLLEIVGEKSRSGKGAWVLSPGAEVASK